MAASDISAASSREIRGLDALRLSLVSFLCVSLNTLVNELPKKDKELIEAAE